MGRTCATAIPGASGSFGTSDTGRSTPAGHVMRWAKQTIKALHGRLVDMDDDKEYTAWRQHIKLSLTTGSLTAMVRQAQCELPVQPEALDTHPWLLNCRTARSTCGQACSATMPERICSPWGSMSPYDTDALCPKWDTFLHRLCTVPRAP